MGVERNLIDCNKINKPNSGDLYRPPALRNNCNETIKRNGVALSESSSNETSNILSKKITPSTSSTTATSITTTTSISCNNSPIHRNENVNTNNITTSTHQTSIYKIQQEQPVDEQQKQSQRHQIQQQTRRERRPDRAVYIPRARRSQTTPPNTAITQIPQQQQPQPPSTQLPALAPITINHTSKSLSQQLAITLDDTTASVNQKPSSKADEVGKINVDGVSACNNNISTTKKKEKLNKESREQRREQRLLRKLSSTATQHIQNHISKNNEKIKNSINIISNNDNGDGYGVGIDIGIGIGECDEIVNQTVFINSEQQIQSYSLINDVNNLYEFSDNNINISKGFNCDNCEENNLNQDQDRNINSEEGKQQEEKQSSDVELLRTNSEFVSLNNYEINNTVIIENSILNESNNELLNKPVPNQSVDINNEIINFTLNDDVNSTNIIITTNCNNNNNTMPKPSNKSKSNKVNSEVSKLPNLRIEDVASQQTSKKCDIEEQELLRASKEINRSNRRIIKQTFVSDVLQIPDNINEEEENKTKSTNLINKTTNNIVRTNTTQSIDSNTEEDEEDDWENMYNESGDCLDPKIMQELTASVGKCKIELPKMDYSAYLTKQSILNEEEFPHVLEVSNFPVEFKNQDLLMVFSQYKESGFDIKWVDDTHALAVFSSSRIAAEVLTMGHPFVVLKPLAEATVESRLKAKKCAASLQPYRPRPETCAALARRLVTGALGVRLKTAAAERENEKRVLREAKERKLLAAKQRDEIWES
ncbi:uncharacterized protein ACRADG_003369 [Cochliomyia hominivorax]